MLIMMGWVVIYDFRLIASALASFAKASEDILHSSHSERRRNGRGDWIRTSDLHTHSVMRYQAALRPDLAAASRPGYPTRQGAAGKASGSATAKR